MLLIALGISTFCRAQGGALDLTVSGNYKNITMIEMLLDLENKYPVKFYFEPQNLPYYSINYTFSDRPLFNVLQTILPENGLSFVASGVNGVIICRKTDINRRYLSELLLRWEKGEVALPEFLQPLRLSFLLGDSLQISTGSFKIQGLILDEKSREPLAGAVLKPAGAGAGASGAISNNMGRFSLELTAGAWEFNLQYPGYRDTHIHLVVHADGNIEIPVTQRNQTLQEVVIKGNTAADKVAATATGLDVLPTRVVRELPSFLGEADIIKSLSVLPGVTTVGEGAGGFNVRGGNIDQNLVLQDGMPLFNTSHVLGFFSVFNPDLVGSTTLYKGHIPARFGGRVSSVLDVQTKSPNYSEWEGSVSAGLVAAKVAAEGPLIPKKLAMLAGVRSSFSDWMLRQANLPNIQKSSAWYADACGKLSFRTNDNGSIEVGGLYSQDYFRYAQDFGYRWSTGGLHAALRQAWSEHWLVSLQYANSRFRNVYFDPEGSDGFELQTGLQYSRGIAQLQYLGWQGHSFRSGAEHVRNSGLPQQRTPFGDASAVSEKNYRQDTGVEWALFLEDEWKINARWQLYGGLRYSRYAQMGPFTQYLYRDGAAIQEENIVDTLLAEAGDVGAQYGGWEPRVSANYRITPNQSLKISYNRTRQYIHLISNTTAATPADIWQVSTAFIPPQIGDNFGAGFFSIDEEKHWEHTFEVFYKTTESLPGYRDFARLLLNDHLETELIIGKGRSYGAEYTLRKNTGKFNGWLSYTWSRAWQQARDQDPTISVNKGAWFPANFDQPHQVNFFGKYAVNPSFYWTFNFSYRSGRPVFAPISGYETGNVVVPNFSERNGLRIPDYHRLDIGFVIDKNKSKIEGLRWTINCSVYNVYGRQNPFTVFFRRDQNGIPKAYTLSAIGAAIPAVNLTFWL